MKKIFPKLVLIITFLVGVVNIITATDFGYESATHTKYAVIINGGGDANRNHISYYNDCAAIYKMLRRIGYQSNNIYVAMSDGTNTDIDLRNGNIPMSSPLDLDSSNNVADIQYAATLDAIQDMFDDLEDNMTSDDDLFIYVTGPGSRNNATEHSYIVLWEEDSVSDVAFAQMLASLHYRTINIVMQQDYSGGFVDDLIALDNIVITTACEANACAQVRYNRLFEEFTFRWISAIQGSIPWPLYPPSNMNPAELFVTSADDNGDGYISMEEAYNHARHYGHPNEQPQIASNPACLARILALDTLLYSGDCSAVLIEGWDLYMKDSEEDYGDEPNIKTPDPWETKAIWFERNGIREETLQSGETYDFCVSIQNRGNIASPANATLYCHWTKSQIGGVWPYGWTDNNSYDCNGTPVPRGEMLGSLNLPSIGPGETYIARVPWTTPLSKLYSPCLYFGGDDLSELWHYCVLARIVDSQEQPDETITNMDFRDFVFDYNNVVSRNVIINDIAPSTTDLTVVVGLTNPQIGEASGPYTLNCQIFGEEDWDQLAKVTLTFSPLFYNSQPYMTEYNCLLVNPDGVFELANSAHFDNIYFEAHDDGFYPMIVNIEYLTSYDPGYYPEFTVVLELVDDHDNTIGGETFHFYNNRSGSANHVIQHHSPFEEEIAIEQTPILPDNILYVDVYNAQGQLLMRTTSNNIGSLSLPRGIYILRQVGENISYSVKTIK